MSQYQVLGERVLVKKELAKQVTGSLLVPDEAKKSGQLCLKGEIIAVGPGARDESGKLVPLDVKSGDHILFGKWSGTEVKIDGEELLIMKESDVMGVIEGKVAARKAA